MKLPQLSSRIWLAICAFLLSVCVVLGVWAVKGRRHSDPLKKIARMDRLNLPPGQKQQARQLFREHRRSHRVVARALRRMERQLQRAIVDPNVSDDQLMELFDKIDAQQAALHRSRFRFTMELRQLIGPENMRPLFRGWNKGKRGRDGHRGRGRDRQDRP